MPSRKYEKRLHIDMGFEEALERFGTTDPKELPDNIKLSRKRKAAADSPAAGTHAKSLGRDGKPSSRKSPNRAS